MKSACQSVYMGVRVEHTGIKPTMHAVLQKLYLYGYENLVKQTPVSNEN